MHWLEIVGAPGSGKSTICDPLWGPKDIEYDGKKYPADWAPFLAVIDKLLTKISTHSGYRTCESMVSRSLKKIATVSRMPGTEIYIQTGLAQRALGIGWRLGAEVEAVAKYYEAMPVSLGVAFLRGPNTEIMERNIQRGKDRSWMVPLVERPTQIGIEVLRNRGVPILELDALELPDDNRNRLTAFAATLVR